MEASNSNLKNVKIISNKKVANGFDVRIFPNPASEYINIVYECDLEKDLTIELFNTLGVLIKSYRFHGTNTHSIDIRDLSGGYYIARITDGVLQKTLPFIKK
jgi:hypothetical protein